LVKIPSQRWFLNPPVLKLNWQRNFVKFPPLERGGLGEILVLGADFIRGKIFGIPDNFSQGIPDDPVNLFPVSPVPPTFELML